MHGESLALTIASNFINGSCCGVETSLLLEPHAMLSGSPCPPLTPLTVISAAGEWYMANEKSIRRRTPSSRKGSLLNVGSTAWSTKSQYQFLQYLRSILTGWNNFFCCNVQILQSWQLLLAAVQCQVNHVWILAIFCCSLPDTLKSTKWTWCFQKIF